MHKSGGDFDGSEADKAEFEQLVEAAALDARAVGRLANLRIDPTQLFLQTTEQTRMALCISDPHQEDCPVVYCNQAFVNLSGYSRDEIIGRNCRFLQGELTRAESAAKLRLAQETEDYTVVHILNYKKDGTPFWNAVHIGPIYDRSGKLAYFFGSQWDVTELITARESIADSERLAGELRHRTDNLFSVLTAIVRLSARGATDVDELAETIALRIQALAGAHRVSLRGEDFESDGTDLRPLVEEVLRPYRNSHPNHIEILGDEVHLSQKEVTPVGLSLHEMATNALKYGALANNDGQLKIDWGLEDEALVIHWMERRGSRAEPLDINADLKGGGSGSRLIDGVIKGIGGSVETSIEDGGFRATITIPRPNE